MRQGMGTWHRRMTTSKTTGLPNNAEYAGEKSPAPSAIMFVSLLGFRIKVSGCTSIFSAAAMGNLFKSAQLSLNVAATGLALCVKTRPILADQRGVTTRA
jgi:hypothetical protein